MRIDALRDAVAAMSREELEEEVCAARLRRERSEEPGQAILSAMTHELRTPLNAILGFTEVLLQGLSGPLSATQVRQLENVDREAKRLFGLVNEVLDFAKAQAGELELGREEFDLGLAAAAAAAAGVEAEAARRGLAFRIDAVEGAVRAVGDARRAEQVMRHLFSNAVKFTERGAVRVEIRREGAEALVLVGDTGIGIPPESLGELFKPFRQLESGRARRFEGMGLGLGLSKLLVEAMGGRIWVESVPGEGSTFGFSLAASGD